MSGAFGTYGREEKFMQDCDVLVNPKGDRSFGVLRCWWEGNIQMNLKLQGGVVWNGFM